MLVYTSLSVHKKLSKANPLWSSKRFTLDLKTLLFYSADCTGKEKRWTGSKFSLYFYHILSCTTNASSKFKNVRLKLVKKTKQNRGCLYFCRWLLKLKNCARNFFFAKTFYPLHSPQCGVILFLLFHLQKAGLYYYLTMIIFTLWTGEKTQLCLSVIQELNSYGIYQHLYFFPQFSLKWLFILSLQLSRLWE